jgi:hypothetical protein
LFGKLLFVSHVDRRSGVITGQHDVQRWRATVLLAKSTDRTRDFAAHRLGNLLSIDKTCHVFGLPEKVSPRKGGMPDRQFHGERSHGRQVLGPPGSGA